MPAKKRGGLKERRPVQIWSSNGMPSTIKRCYVSWPTGETSADSEGRSVFSDPLAVETDMQRLRPGMKASQVWDARSDLDCHASFFDQICTETSTDQERASHGGCFQTSTQTLHVGRLPGDGRTRSHPPETALVSPFGQLT